MKEIVGKNGLQILTFWRSLQTGKMSSSSRNGDRQTANAGNVGSRDPLCRSREKKYAVLNLSIVWSATAEAWPTCVRALKCSDFLSCNLLFVLPM